MTPKEKATELVKKFDLPSGLMSIERKQCALIVVDEIIHTLYDLDDSGQDVNYEKGYFYEVKEEIENL